MPVDKDSAVTGCCIREITGLTDDVIVKAILVTGASRKEIQQACDACFENLHVKAGRIRPMSDRVRRIFDILDYSRDFAD